jgi:hypothetical protein
MVFSFADQREFAITWKTGIVASFNVQMIKKSALSKVMMLVYRAGDPFFFSSSSLEPIPGFDAHRPP